MENKLPQAGIVLVDREGQKKYAGRNDPFGASLHMFLELDELLLEIDVFSSPYSNGSSRLQVTDRTTGEVLYDGGGDYFSLGAGSKPTVYRKGPWEAKVLGRSKPYVARIR